MTINPADNWVSCTDFALCRGIQGIFAHAFALLCVSACAGSSVSGYDDTSSDNSTADAADPSAASPEPSAAPGSSPAATGPHVTAGNVPFVSRITSSDQPVTFQVLFSLLVQRWHFIMTHLL